MKIGVDAYYLFSTYIDGLGNYLLRLLKELSHIDTVNEYILYTPGITQAAYAGSLIGNPRFHINRITGMFPGRRRLWLQSPSLRRQVLRDRIDLFFAGAEYFPLFLPRSIRVATTIHDVAFRAMPEAISLPNIMFYRLMFPFFVRRTDDFFTVSHYSKREMMHYLHIDGSLIHVVHNGIDPGQFTPGEEGAKKNYILFVGTLQPRKNLANLVRAFALIAGTVRDDLVIVGGSGWKNSSLRGVIDGLGEGIRRRIIFRGYISGEELSTLYREAKLFALPSLHEGFCLPILEAMASGTAVVTARSTAIPEVFGDAVAYTDPLSPEDIAARIGELLADPARRADLRNRGLALAPRYSVERQAAGYLAAFQEIEQTYIRKRGAP